MKLREQLESEAARFGITICDCADGVEVCAPDGFQFGPELHCLVSSQWDGEPIPNVLRRAIQDVRENGPRLQPCPHNCTCKE